MKFPHRISSLLLTVTLVVNRRTAVGLSCLTDLLSINGKIFTSQGAAIAKNAATSVAELKEGRAMVSDLIPS